jgi:hypothetical protein
MRWTWEDKEKLGSQVVEILEGSGKEDSIKQVIDLIADTFLISGCPVGKVYILNQLDTFLTFCKNRKRPVRRRLAGSSTIGALLSTRESHRCPALSAVI